MSEDGPHDAVLDRDFYAVQMRELIAQACGLLRQVIDYASWALVRCNPSTPSSPDEHLAPLALYRHVIEMADAVEILLRSCAPHEALPNLRSEFEGWLSIEYILRDPAKFHERSYAWLTTYAAKRFESYERLLPGTTSHAEFKATVESDVTADDIFQFPEPERVQQAAANMRSLLVQPHLAPAKAEYDAVKTRKGRRGVHWYELFAGPRSLRQLARELGYGASYSILYGHWSNVSHASDFSDFMTKRDGRAAMRPLREPHDIPHVSSLALSMLLNSTRMMLVKFRDEGESYERWYVTSVRDQFRSLQSYHVTETAPKK